MLHTKFHGNQPTGSRDEYFLKAFTIYGRGSHLGHVTSIMASNLHFLVPESFQKKKMVQNGIIVSEKIWFEFLHVHNLGPWSRKILTFNTHIPS